MVTSKPVPSFPSSSSLHPALLLFLLTDVVWKRRAICSMHKVRGREALLPIHEMAARCRFEQGQETFWKFSVDHSAQLGVEICCWDTLSCIAIHCKCILFSAWRCFGRHNSCLHDEVQGSPSTLHLFVSGIASNRIPIVGLFLLHRFSFFSTGRLPCRSTWTVFGSTS